MDHIFRFWEAQAKKFDTSPEASWADQHAIALEVSTLSQYLPDEGRILDVGCANAHATIQIAAPRPKASFFGVDFSPQMIRAGEVACKEQGAQISLSVADARLLPFPDNFFSASFTTRTLINLSTWEDQKQAISELLRVTKPGGAVVLCEAFWEPLMALNSLRIVVGLGPLREHDFNRYLKIENVREFLDGHQIQFILDPFSSIYYLGSRVLRELCTNPLDFPGFTNPVNKEFFDIETKYSGGPFSVQSAIVFSAV